jgi:ABC-type nitrate/sulfonate/bicarbonate transport system ATPase subunit
MKGALGRGQGGAFHHSHDLAEAIALSDRVLVMSPRPGRIIEEIVVDLPDRDHPIARRRNPGFARCIPHLMELLHVGESVASDPRRNHGRGDYV